MSRKALALGGLGLGLLAVALASHGPGPGAGKGWGHAKGFMPKLPKPTPQRPDLVVWAGPVAEYQVPGATVDGAILKFIPCTGNGSPSCGQIADSWTDGQGRKLPAMLASLGLDEDSVGDIFLGAFSAGGSTWKRLLMHPADRARIRAVVLSDATYSSPVLEPIEGFVRYGLDVLEGGDKLLLATASASPNHTYGTGAEVMIETAKEIERRSGVPFEEAIGDFGEIPQPDRLYLAPNITFADYGWQGSGHGYHPKIAPAWWKGVLQPWLAERRGP